MVFFSALEIAFLSIDSFYLDEKIESGNKKAIKIKKTRMVLVDFLQQFKLLLH